MSLTFQTYNNSIICLPLRIMLNEIGCFCFCYFHTYYLQEKYIQTINRYIKDYKELMVPNNKPRIKSNHSTTYPLDIILENESNLITRPSSSIDRKEGARLKQNNLQCTPYDLTI